MSIVHEQASTPRKESYTSKLLDSEEVSNMVPSLLDSEETSEDSLLRVADSDSSVDDHEEDSKNEVLMNSSPTKNYQSITSLKFNSFSEDPILFDQDEKMDKTIRINSEDMDDEYPLFGNPELLNNSIIDDEFRISSPEKPINDSISSRVKRSHITTSKSKIPILTGAAIRRSKRLNNSEPMVNQCTPKKLTTSIKSSIKNNLSTLNFIVNSSSGELHDATKYATEINAANSEGILIPNNPNELVSIPVLGTRLASKSNKLAFVRAYEYSHNNKNESVTTRLGFYTEEQHKKYFSLSESPAKISKIIKTKSPKKNIKKLRWAAELEW